MSSFQKFSYTSPKGDKYVMTVSPTERKVTKNGVRISPSRLPSPVQKHLMRSAMRLSNGSKTIQGLPDHVLALVAKDLSVFEIIQQFCSLGYAMHQNVCHNKTFWTHWLEEQTPEQLLKKMTDWFLKFNNPPDAKILSKTVKFISMFFINHPKGIQTIPFVYLVQQYEKTVTNASFLSNLKKSRFFDPLKRNQKVYEAVINNSDKRIQFDNLNSIAKFSTPLEKILFSTIMNLRLRQEDVSYIFIVELQLSIITTDIQSIPMYYLLKNTSIDYLLANKSLRNQIIFDLNALVLNVEFVNDDDESVEDDIGITFENFIKLVRGVGPKPKNWLINFHFII